MYTPIFLFRLTCIELQTQSQILWTQRLYPPVQKPQLQSQMLLKPVIKPTVGIAKSTTITSSKVTTCSGRVVKPPTKLNL